jgi:hypothetical protein
VSDSAGDGAIIFGDLIGKLGSFLPARSRLRKKRLNGALLSWGGIDG